MTTKKTEEKEPIRDPSVEEGERMDLGVDTSKLSEEDVQALKAMPVDSRPEDLKPEERPVPPEQNGDVTIVGDKVTANAPKDPTASGRISKTGVEGDEEQQYHAIPGEGGVFELQPDGTTRKA